jgi:hypothetical protein
VGVIHHPLDKADDPAKPLVKAAKPLELAGLLRSIVGGASLVEGGPSIGEEFFHLVGLRRRVGVPAGMEDVVVFRCVAARGVWL